MRFSCLVVISLKSYTNLAACNEHQCTDQMRTNFSQVLLSGRNDGYSYQYTKEEILQRRRQQANGVFTVLPFSVSHWTTSFTAMFLKCSITIIKPLLLEFNCALSASHSMHKVARFRPGIYTAKTWIQMSAAATEDGTDHSMIRYKPTGTWHNLLSTVTDHGYNK